jgi:hypothetical protein
MKLRINTSPPWEKQPEDTGRGAERQYCGWPREPGYRLNRAKRLAAGLYDRAK